MLVFIQHLVADIDELLQRQAVRIRLVGEHGAVFIRGHCAPVTLLTVAHISCSISFHDLIGGSVRQLSDDRCFASLQADASAQSGFPDLQDFFPDHFVFRTGLFPDHAHGEGAGHSGVLHIRQSDSECESCIRAAEARQLLGDAEFFLGTVHKLDLLSFCRLAIFPDDLKGRCDGNGSFTIILQSHCHSVCS